MIRTGTRAMTTLASEKIVERRRPNEELMKAVSSMARRDWKKTLAVLVRLQGKYAITRKRKQVRISTGRMAKVLPM